jgi:hypothetical protein
MIQTPRRIRDFSDPRHSTRSLSRLIVLALILLTLASSNVVAAVTYYDGVWGASGNTTLLGGAVFTPAANGAAVDNQWKERTGGAGFGHNSTIMESNGNSGAAAENAPMLETTITGLTPNTEYNIYGYFWSNTTATQDWKFKGTVNAALINDNGTPLVPSDDFLPTIAGVSFSKFGSLTAPLATNAPAVATGFDGADNLGATFDTAGLSTSYFTAPTRIKSPGTDNSLAMFQANLGTATADAGGQIKVYIDDLASQATASSRTWYDGVGYDLAGQPTLTINRQTGAMVFSTGVARDIIGYSILSGSGTLNQASWTTVAGHYDAAVGANGSVDANDTWRVLSDPASSNDLSEAELGTTGPLDGALLAPGATINFGTPWRKYFAEDVQMQILRNDAEGTIENVTVVYTGNGGLPFQKGDFNFNGTIGPEDYAIFVGNLYGTMPSSSAASYALGDITGDLAVNYADFAAFRDIYDSANGAGAFAGMVSGQVPEPQSIVLVGCLGAVLLAGYRKRKSSIPCWEAIASYGQSLAIVAVLLLLTSSSVAQTTYVDATDDVSGNTTFLDGTTFTATSAGSNDDLWRERTGFGNNNSFFESNAYGGVGENARMLTTTITGLAPGAQYYIYGYFWTNPIENWRLKATLNPQDISDNGTPGDTSDDFLGNLPAYAFSSLGSPTSTTAPLAQARHFAGTPLLSGGGTVMHEAALGTVAADAGGTVKVYIDDLSAQTTATFRTEYDGVGYERITPLTLQVNTVTGATRIANKTGVPVAFDYYQITSALNSLNLAGWQSLDAQNIDAVDGDDGGTIAGDSQLEGWDAAGGSSSSTLGEVNFLASSMLVDQAFKSIGNAFQTGDSQDLQFSFEMGGRLRPGLVEYVTSFPEPVLGDYDNNGFVEAADYAKWRETFGSTTVLGADGNGNNVVDAADYVIWRKAFGSSGSGTSSLADSAAVPEPTAMTLLGIVGLIGGLSQMRKRNSLCSRKISLAFLAMAAFALQGIGAAQAAVTNDREYWFGEDTLEGPSQDAIIGSNNTAPLTAGNTADSIGPTGAYLDLTQSGDPVYVNVGASGLNRPGAASGTFGAKFDGVDDYLSGTPLNRPDELATLVPGYPITYTGITARGLQMWVYPNAATIGTRRQTIVMDTVTAGGVAITANGRWTEINDGHFDDDDITPSVSVVGNQWYHVMQHVYHSADAGAPKVVSGTADLGFTGIVYVNGIAVAANNDTPNVGDSIAGSRVGVLVVGAEELADTEAVSATPIIGNYFDGTIDNLEMYVYGDNTAQGGQNYGTFGLFADNKWIANQITTLPGGILKNGDLNRDGNVTIADVDAFVANWLDRKLLAGAHNTVTAGDWETWGWGDMDHDGVVYLKDAFIMQRAMIQAGLGSLILGEGGFVPEPSSALLVAMGAGALGARPKRRRRR